MKLSRHDHYNLFYRFKALIRTESEQASAEHEIREAHALFKSNCVNDLGGNVCVQGTKRPPELWIEFNQPPYFFRARAVRGPQVFRNGEILPVDCARSREGKSASSTAPA